MEGRERKRGKGKETRVLLRKNGQKKGREKA